MIIILLWRWNVMLGVSFWVMGLMPEVGPTYSAPRFTPAVPGKTPDCVRDPRDTFCIRSDNYPKERILYLLENKMYDIDSLLADESRNTYTFEGRDAPAQPTMTYDYRPPPSSYLPPRHNSSTRFVRSSRQRRQSAEMDLCPVRADYITPQAARNNQGDWKFLVNLNEVNPQYTQLVRSEKCISNRCTGVCNVPEGFIAVCQQQYVQKRLISLDSSGERLSTDAFLFPSCCVCKVKPAE
ncbi:neurotrophin 1-like isoform X3 [Oratosquilla oratoria]|uniref:neurotrophin 1-like isoform X3 n=1 Tax=Oratosquilla oratoria TaxID=337810 RepID=UPI003F75A318